MRILEISNYYPEHIGGIEFVALNLVQQWRQQNQVRWLACDVKTCPHVASPDDIPLPAGNFTEEHLGFPYPIPIRDSIATIFKQTNWCDVVHVNDCLYLASLIAFIASRWYHKPLLITQHVGLIQYDEAYKNTLQEIAYTTFGKFVLEHAAQVTFISKRVKDWFEVRMRFREPAILLSNGVDHKLFYPSTDYERNAVRYQLGYSENNNVLLFVGRFTQKKGLDIIRAIAKALPHYCWLLVGSGEINPLEWDLHNLKVIPPQPQTALRQYYIAADLFVIPSTGEGFPLAVQEALSCGLPAAISLETAAHLPDAPLVRLDLSQLPKILEDIVALFKAQDRLSSMRVAAEEYAHKWDWNSIASEYEKILVKLSLSPRSYYHKNSI